MNEAQVQAFWQAHPCGDQQVGGLDQAFRGDYEQFFRQYDAFRYGREDHILGCLDGIDFRDAKVLEIGLGEAGFGADHSSRGALVRPRPHRGIRGPAAHPAGTPPAAL